jgi:uncharacterized protein (TIGR03086 family)
VVRDAIQQALDDPAVAGRVADCGPPGSMSLEAAIDMTCIPDVLVHTWDLARATGQDDALDADEVHQLLVGLESMPPEVEAGMRASGHYSPKTPVGPDADEQTRLIAFTGRPVG